MQYIKKGRFQNSFFATAMLLTLFTASLLSAETYLQRFADVSQTQVVFTYENDLWLLPIEGGTATRLTRAEGSEIFAKFSPDGKQIAFTAHYNGGTDVYVMPVEGGNPTRLTWHPSGDLVLDWFPDGKHILFRARRNYPYRADQLYKVAVDGGSPELLPVDRAGLATLSPDGKSVAYNRNSREFRTWKRHKGGTAQDIWMGSFAEKNYQKISSFDGTDNFPMWHGNFIYFVSDRNDGTLNLFKYDIASKNRTALTHYKDYDLKYPSLGPDYIVFQYGEQIHLFNLATEKVTKLNIEMPGDHFFTGLKYHSASQNIDNFALSNDGYRALFSVRGEILSFPTEEEAPIFNLTKTSASREKNAVWSPDGKNVAFFSDQSGEEEVYFADPNGIKPWRQVTTGGKGFRMNIVWSPDSKYLLFHDKKMRLNLVNANSGKITIVDQSDYDDAWELWGIQDYVWSPDSRYVAYAKMEQSLNQSIFIYDLNAEKSYRVTGHSTQDWSPSFSPDGNFLYFLSNRDFNPVMGFVDQNHIFLEMAKPYAVILRDGLYSPFDKLHKNKVAKKKDVKVVISTNYFEARTVAAQVKPGNLFRLEATEKGLLYLRKTEDEFLKYQTVTDANNGKNLNLVIYDLDDQKEKTLIEGISQYHISADGKKLIYKSGNSFGVVDAGKKGNVGDGTVDLASYKFQTDPKAEFLQIYNEAWRVQRDWFYDKNMHGLNWEKTGNKYRKFIPYCGKRDDVNYLIGEMIAEINAGHTYIYGGERESYERISTGLLGADIVQEEGAFPKIGKIYDDWIWESHSPLSDPGCPIKSGDYILAIDGEKLNPGDNIYKYLQNRAGKIIELTYNTRQSWKNAKSFNIKAMSSEYSVRYRNWVNNNRKYVVEKTADKVAYIHLPAMGADGLIEFAREYYPNYYKDGIIIDARYNGGGFTSKMILDRLERQLQSLTQPREGKVITDPERVFNGKLILLINRDTGSDGELFAESWERRKLGPVIGQRTWGGAVGIEAHQNLLDGALTTPPQFGPYSFPSKWIIEGHGVDPTIEVINMPKDVLAGKDAQLDKAIKVVLKELKDNPNKFPIRPPYEDKSKPTLK